MATEVAKETTAVIMMDAMIVVMMSAETLLEMRGETTMVMSITIHAAEVSTVAEDANIVRIARVELMQ